MKFMKKKENGEQKPFGRILAAAQSTFIVVLIVLVALMMVEINKLQGTARVINYAGLVRGATQRLIKLELTGNPKDELVVYLDEVLKDLKCGEGSYKLVCLADESYQKKLEKLDNDWDRLKEQIEVFRLSSYDSEAAGTLLEMSESYFEQADETVSAAEIYSEKIARKIRLIEIASAVDMCLLFVMIVEQTVSAVRMRRKNKVLEQKAYIDTHTGLQNKNMCEELLENKDVIAEPTACIMFDINNLKQTNDTLGHLVGDQLIADFAGALKSVVRKNDFAGRYGGDEFMIVLYDVDKYAVDDILTRLCSEVERFNSLGKNTAISYACGWALSTDYKQCTFRKLFAEADRCMYLNKQMMKRKEQK